MAITAFDIRQIALEEPLQQLELHYCFKNAQELGVLSSLTALQLLNVSFNQVSHLMGIQDLTTLRCLDVSHNQITSIEQVSALRGLTSLYAGGNQIQVVTALQDLEHLEVLTLHNNNVHKASTVLGLSALGSLKHLTLASNPICRQGHWQPATIAVLSRLQVLDSNSITQADRVAAQPHASTWRQAVQEGDASYSSTSKGGKCGAASAAPSQGLSVGSKQVSSAGRLTAQNTTIAAAGGCGTEHIPKNAGVEDVCALLPVIHVPILKPASILTRKAEQQHTSSVYGWNRGAPATTVQKQRYQGTVSTATAVEVCSDGSAAVQWPDGSMAVSLDVEAGMNGAYRLLAMYRSVMGVAASFDSNGGFVQYPSGGLMLVWNKKDGTGTCYGPDGIATHSFNSRKKSLGLKQDVEQQLDKHYRVLFKAHTYELQLFYSCEGCSISLSLIHGAMLSEELAAEVDAPAAVMKASVEPPKAAAEGNDTQAMLAKARALLAADFDINITAEPTNHPTRNTATANSSVTQATRPATSSEHAVSKTMMRELS